MWAFLARIIRLLSGTAPLAAPLGSDDAPSAPPGSDDAAFMRCLAVTLKWEGGFSNHPRDPGGATMRGVTQAVYNEWRAARGFTTQSVKRLSSGEMHAIYYGNYWLPSCAGDYSPGFDLCVFDAAVNLGVGRARRWCSVASQDTGGRCAIAHAAIDALCDARLAFLRKLKTWPVFGKGWSNRVADIRARAHAMARDAGG